MASGSANEPVAVTAEVARAAVVSKTAQTKTASTQRGWKHVVAGHCGGWAGIIAAFPLDTVKVRLQASPGTYNGAVDCFRSMIAEEGVRSLYRGMLPPLLGYGAINAVAFGTYGRVSMYFRNGDDAAELPLSQMVFAGACAGLTSAFVRGPVERVKTLMQMHKKPDGSSLYRNTWHCIKHTVRTQGMSALMTGVNSTILREAAQYAIYYPVYEITKRMLRPADAKEGDLSIVRTLLAGAIAGMAQWLPPTYCVDVVKSRIQSHPPGTYGGMMACAREAYAAEGASVFFRGLSPALLRAACMHGPIFLVYELTLKLLK